MRSSIAIRVLVGGGCLILGVALTLALGWFSASAGPGPNPGVLQTPTPPATGSPSIVLLRATPSELAAGHSFLLEWRSVNATRGFLATDGLPGEGRVPSTGSLKFEAVPAGTYRLHLLVRDDADPPQSDEASIVVDVAEATGAVIVDDGDADFTRHGNPDYWWEAEAGYGGDMVWTYVNGDVLSNWIEWRPQLPVCGDYSVAAFIPAQNATSRQARYEIYFAASAEVRPLDESPRIVLVNQAVHSDQWALLGTYRFAAGSEGYVRLADATGEDPNSLRQIGFDAVRWRLEARCATRVFLPLVRR